MTKVPANWGELPEGSAVSVFDVLNTNFNHLYVLAADKKSAMAVACSANHILDTREIHEDYYFRAADEVDLTKDKNLQPFTAAIQQAIARRLQGTLRFSGDQLFVGDELIGV
jgi:hypothetical protein